MVLLGITVILLSLFIGSFVGSIWLFQQNGSWRRGGIILFGETCFLLICHYLLSTIPFGIGDPLLRVTWFPIVGQILGILILASGIGLCLLTIRRRIRYMIDQQLPQRFFLFGLLSFLPIVSFVLMAMIWQIGIPERERERDPQKRTIELSEGFAWQIYAQGTIDNPTTITFGPDGNLYIADIAGDLWQAKDTNGDHMVDRITQWSNGFDLLVGLVWYKDELFVASSGKIEALQDTNSDGIADSRRIVVENLPSMVLRPHSNNGLALGPDHRLYFGVGSTTDGEREEHPFAATVLSVNPDGTDLQVFARGLGNVFDVAFNSNGDLFGGDNSPSGGENREELPDEFNYLEKDQYYGYPYYFGDPPKNGGTQGALISFPPHSVPTGVMFYTGDMFPKQYHDSAFITLWKTGEIAHIEVGKTVNGTYSARSTIFGKGFLYPIDIITGPDGALYVADFGTSAIYRIISK